MSAVTVTVTGTAGPVLIADRGRTSDNQTIISPTPGAPTVYLADDRTRANPAFGVPLVGGTSIPWTLPGPIFAGVVSGSSAVTVTDAVGAWYPPPVPTPGTDVWAASVVNAAGISQAPMTESTPNSWGNLYLYASGTYSNTTVISGTPTIQINLLAPSIGLSKSLGAFTASSVSTNAPFTISVASVAVPHAPYSLTLQYNAGSTDKLTAITCTASLVPT